MYKDFYHLTAEPFNTHPKTDTFFISSTHKEAWYYLLFGIDTHEPFIVLTGEFGMGKTLLCLQVLKIAKEKGMSRVEYIPTTNEGYGGILRRMATNMGISPLPENEEILQDMVYDRFRAEKGQSRFYLIIDDAHELDTTTLAKLKYLSTFSYNEFFPVVMIFVAHPSFLQDLKTPALSSLNQRIKRRYHLSRLSLEDTKNYIYYRLLKSGGTGVPSFSDQTIQKIFEYSGGVPRLINNICDTCLLIGASNHMVSIPPAVVEEAKRLVEGSLANTEETAVREGDSPYKSLHTQAYSDHLRADDATSRADFSSNRIVTDEDEQEATPPKVSVSGKRLKNALMIVIVAVLLMTLVALLSQLFMKDNKTFPFFSSNTVTEMKRQPEQSGKANMKAPALTDELSGKPSGQTPIPAARDESLPTVPSENRLRDELSGKPSGQTPIPEARSESIPSVASENRLRDELSGKPSGQTPIPAARSESMPSLPARYR
jgi:type II secretory pathway predicted ATPase ExeA